MTTFDEMCVILSHHAADFDQLVSARLVFNLLDKERKGYVVADDVVQFCHALRMQLSKEDAEKLVKSTSLHGHESFSVMDMHATLMFY
jgi:Ca2+-binding EF-hand superfamily protein